MESTVDSLQIGESQRQLALKSCFAQIHQWNIALPDSNPLVMDFGLGDFERIGLIEFWIANEIEAGYCGKYMFVADGQTCPRHSHHVKHETFYVVRGEMAVTLDDEELVLSEGQTLAINPGRVHSFSGIGPALMLELSMPCDPCDNYFEDPTAMAWLRKNVGESGA